MKGPQRVALELALLLLTVTAVLCLNLKFGSDSKDLLVPALLSTSDSDWPTHHLFRNQHHGPTHKEWDLELQRAAIAMSEEDSARQKIAGRVQDTIRMARERDIADGQQLVGAVKSPNAKVGTRWNSKGEARQGVYYEKRL